LRAVKDEKAGRYLFLCFYDRAQIAEFDDPERGKCSLGIWIKEEWNENKIDFSWRILILHLINIHSGRRSVRAWDYQKKRLEKLRKQQV